MNANAADHEGLIEAIQDGNEVQWLAGCTDGRTNEHTKTFAYVNFTHPLRFCTRAHVTEGEDL